MKCQQEQQPFNIYSIYYCIPIYDITYSWFKACRDLAAFVAFITSALRMIALFIQVALIVSIFVFVCIGLATVILVKGKVRDP